MEDKMKITLLSTTFAVLSLAVAASYPLPSYNGPTEQRAYKVALAD
jgi:hypothetical protein